MKNIIKNLFVTLMVIAGFTSCEQTDDEPMLGNFNPPVILTPSSGTEYLLTEETQDNTVEVLKWEAADYGFLAAVTYSIQIAPNEDFSEPFELATSNGTELELTEKQLNDAALEYIDAGQKGELWLRLKASINDNVETLYSEPVSISVTPFESIKVIEPLFIVGDILGEDFVWNNNNYTYITFRNSSDPNVFEYTYTGYLKAGGFKLLPELGNWDRQFGISNGEIVKDDGGSGNITVDAAGYYTFTINTDEITFNMQPYDASGNNTYTTIGLIGEFNEWSADLALTQSSYDEHIWTADDVVLGGELKFRANESWDANWGGDSFPYGKGVSGGANIVVPEGTYFVKFNDLTNHYVFYSKEVE
jgi:hypothetical protein